MQKVISLDGGKYEITSEEGALTFYRNNLLWKSANDSLAYSSVVRFLVQEHIGLKEQYIALEQLCERTYVAKGADAYNHCCEIFKAWRAKRDKAGLPTHGSGSGLYDSLNWLQDRVEELEAEVSGELDTLSPYTVVELTRYVKTAEQRVAMKNFDDYNIEVKSNLYFEKLNEITQLREELAKARLTNLMHAAAADK